MRQVRQVSGEEEEGGLCEQQTVRHQCQAFLLNEVGGKAHAWWVSFLHPSVWCVRGRAGWRAALGVLATRVKATHGLKKGAGEALLQFGC